jgi:hypothetical protein
MQYYTFPNVTDSPILRAPQFNQGKIKKNNIFLYTSIILSCVRGSVTNNDGFWIGWFDLLTISFTITCNHNQLQDLTINLLPNPSSLTPEDSLRCTSTVTDSLLNYCITMIIRVFNDCSKFRGHHRIIDINIIWWLIHYNRINSVRSMNGRTE